MGLCLYILSQCGLNVHKIKPHMNRMKMNIKFLSCKIMAWLKGFKIIRMPNTNAGYPDDICNQNHSSAGLVWTVQITCLVFRVTLSYWNVMCHTNALSSALKRTCTPLQCGLKYWYLLINVNLKLMNHWSN